MQSFCLLEQRGFEAQACVDGLIFFSPKAQLTSGQRQ